MNSIGALAPLSSGLILQEEIKRDDIRGKYLPVKLHMLQRVPSLDANLDQLLLLSAGGQSLLSYVHFFGFFCYHPTPLAGNCCSFYEN